MKKKYLKFAVAFLAAGLAVTTASCGKNTTTTTTTEAAGGNNNAGGNSDSTGSTDEADITGSQIANGNFNNAAYDQTGWSLNVCENGAATAEVVNGALKIDVTDTGTKNYSIQLLYSPVKLEKGKQYKLKFDAKATGALSKIEFQLGGGEDVNYDWYGGLTSDTTGSYSTYETTITMTKNTNENARVAICLGTYGVGTFYIDHVSLVEVASDNAGSGDAGSGDAGSGDAGSGDTGSGDTGSGDTTNNKALTNISFWTTGTDYTIEGNKITYTDVSGYGQCMGFSVPSDIADNGSLTFTVKTENADGVSFALQMNNGAEVEADKVTYDYTSSIVEKDGASVDNSEAHNHKFTLTSAGTITVTIKVPTGAKTIVMFMDNISYGAEGAIKKSGSVEFIDASYTEKTATSGDGSSDAGSGDTPTDPIVEKNTINFSAGTVYTCTNEAGKSTITYTSVEDNTYSTVFADISSLTAGKNKVTFNIKNNGTEDVLFYIDLGHNNNPGVTSQITSQTGADWLDPSNNRAKVNVTAGGTRTITLEFTNTESSTTDALIMFINSGYVEKVNESDPNNTYTDGNIEILDMVFDTVTTE